MKWCLKDLVPLRFSIPQLTHSRQELMAASLKKPPFIFYVLEKQKKTNNSSFAVGSYVTCRVHPVRGELCVVLNISFTVFFSYFSFTSACTHGRLLWFCIWSVLRVEFYFSRGMSFSVSHVDDKCLPRNSQEMSCFPDHVCRSTKSLTCSLEKSKSTYSGGITTTFLNSKVWRSRNNLK